MIRNRSDCSSSFAPENFRLDLSETVVGDGSIIEQGTHDGLLAKGGFYRDLYESQFGETDMD